MPGYDKIFVSCTGPENSYYTVAKDGSGAEPLEIPNFLNGEEQDP